VTSAGICEPRRSGPTEPPCEVRLEPFPPALAPRPEAIQPRRIGWRRAQGGGCSQPSPLCQVLATIAEITQTEMRSLADLGDAWPFRHGGDEISFVVVGRRSGVDVTHLEFVVAAALTRATRAVKDTTSDVATVPHTKPGGPSGTGIVWGTSVIGPNASATDVFSEADRKVEAKKTNATR
jgi:hypothetical protein